MSAAVLVTLVAKFYAYDRKRLSTITYLWPGFDKKSFYHRRKMTLVGTP